MIQIKKIFINIMSVLVIFLIISLLGWSRFVYMSKEGIQDGSKGDTGATGSKGDTGGIGPMGPVGQRGEPGPAGASIFDVSRLMLNGDTDLFKQKDKINNNNNNDNKDGPQPLGSHSTLFS